MRLAKVILDNIYLRNTLLFSLIILPVLIPTPQQDIEYRDVSYKAVSILFLYLTMMLHNLVFFEKLLMRKKYALYIISSVLSVYIMHKLLIALEVYTYRTMPQNTNAQWLSVFWVDLVYIYAGFAVYLAHRYFKEEAKANNIKLLHKELELKQLKEQLHPHFLFNALNNIYSHSLQNNEKTNELILMLSEQMRYILTRSEAETSTITEEVKFINNYIGFEKERLGSRCKVDFSISIKDNPMQIQPLLLFPLIENAFKHGTNTVNNCEIHIHLEASSGKIYFSIRNRIFNNSKVVSTNTGLSNLKRRLELLYPDLHSFKINTSEQQYHVELTIYASKETKMHNN